MIKLYGLLKLATLWFSFSLQVTYSIHTVRVELYESAGDYVRLVLEIILSIWVCIQILSEFWNILQAKRQQVQYRPSVMTSLAAGDDA